MKRPHGLGPVVLFVFSLAAVACGVPISGIEITATAESEAGLTGATLFELPTQASSRGANPSSGDETLRSSVTPTATPVATLRAPSTGTAVTPPATALPGAATAGVTGTTSATPSVTGTPASTTSATAVLTPTPESTPTPAPPSASPTEALQLLNALRSQSGLSALTANASLETAASNYARYLAQNNFFGHDGLDGSNPQSRAKAAGYESFWRGEALAAGQASAREALQVWLNSSPHRAIILDSLAGEIGIGYYYDPGSIYKHYWVLETGIP